MLVSLADGKFVYKDGKLQTDLITDFAYRSVHEMTIKAKQIIKTYYGQAPNYSYWNGCSTGGRQGLMEAQLIMMVYIYQHLQAIGINLYQHNYGPKL